MNDARASERGRVVELTFRTDDTAYPFVDISRSEGCEVELLEILPHGTDQCVEYFSVTGVDPDRVADRVDGWDVVETRSCHPQGRGGLFEFVVSSACPARRLVELGAVPHEVVGVDGEGRIRADVPASYDTSAVVEDFLDDHAVELVTKRRKATTTPLLTEREFRRALDDRLTDRQREVLRTAFEAGYYERPRGTTGEDVADELGIAPATFSQHVRAAERKLLSLLYEENGL